MIEEPDRPLNIWSRSEEEAGRLMSNFAYAPFELDGVEYASVEAFYVCLLLSAARRERVRRFWGLRAKHECPKVLPAEFHYGGQTIKTGSTEHWELIKKATRAKLRAHPALAQAFAETAPRRLVHQTGYPDGDVFPNAVLCRILTELRDELLATIRPDSEPRVRSPQ